MMTVMEPEFCWFRGEKMHLADARMMLTEAEMAEVEVEDADGNRVRPYRFSSDASEVRSKDGETHI
jgi:hypothetical protein